MMENLILVPVIAVGVALGEILKMTLAALILLRRAKKQHARGLAVLEQFERQQTVQEVPSP